MAKKKFSIKFHHSGFENVFLLSLILLFFVILAPLAYTSLPEQGAGPKYDVVTGLAAGSTMEADTTNLLLVFLAIAFLVPVELMLRKHTKTKKRK